MQTYDVVVVGYGVSGLTLASVLDPSIKVLVVEHGKKHLERNHDDPSEALLGCGGAGLFSDGKVSFFPAGTKVWQLEPTVLQKSYQQLIADLHPYIDIEVDEIDGPNQLIGTNSDWVYKPYPSHYIGLPERIEIIGRLVKKSSAKIIYQHLVKSVTKNTDGYDILISDIVTNVDFTVKSKYVVLAGGRFMPLYLRGFGMVYRRIEYGARIISSADTEDMVQTGITDPKYILTRPDFEARTFCWCKKGEAILTDNLRGIRSYSGRADNETSRSMNETNFGLNVRIRQENIVNLETLTKIEPYEIHLKENTKDLKQKLISIMGDPAGAFFHEALDQLLVHLPSLINDKTRIVGPTIEGVGYYPKINEKTLQVEGENIYCCGDASGIFRGIVASMLSGYFVGYGINKLLIK